jgi:sugar phosphate isomerase/epimerase
MFAQAAVLVKLAGSYGLKILMLQPLNQFDGWPKGHKRKEWSYRKAEKWLQVCSKLGVEQIQVRCCFESWSE